MIFWQSISYSDHNQNHVQHHHQNHDQHYDDNHNQHLNDHHLIDHQYDGQYFKLEAEIAAAVLGEVGSGGTAGCKRLIHNNVTYDHYDYD